ncbi:MAG: alpha,alpha-trehalase, partial [Bacteroidales bacterium]|nr:alpha,alpha-trehalase [Bacteroidales bacterium]
LALRGLGSYGYDKDARRQAGKYVNMVCDVFAATGNLWEKYNVIDGSVAEGLEYQTPPMLGWSAGAFLYCCSVIENSKL